MRAPGRALSFLMKDASTRGYNGFWSFTGCPSAGFSASILTAQDVY